MKPELLMPAGDLEKAKIAFQFGADACYGSTPAFSMRTREVGFTISTLKEAIEYAHKMGKKFYVTVNIYPHENELMALERHLRKIISMKPDAVIVADLGVLAMTKKLKSQEAKKLDIHLSTQANATNSATIKQYARLGIKRVILPREISIDNIKRIRKNLPKSIELEAFVHGAMCMSVSGRCHLSNFLTGRDANHGQCVQSCRWNYALIEEKRPNDYFPIEEDMNYSYIFNARDLCMIEHLDKLQSAGVSSFKVEGRNKSIYYCAIVARAYRRAIDTHRFYSQKGHRKRSGNRSESSNEAMKQLIYELSTVTSRGYSTGFYFGKPTGKDVNYKTSRPSSNWQFVGIISSVIPSKTEGSFRYIVDVRNEIKPGTKVEIVTLNKIYKIKLDKLTTPDAKTLPKANPNDEIILEHKSDLPVYSMIRAKLV